MPAHHPNQRDTLVGLMNEMIVIDFLVAEPAHNVSIINLTIVAITITTIELMQIGSPSCQFKEKKKVGLSHPILCQNKRLFSCFLQ
jgi:hypothetical protein